MMQKLLTVENLSVGANSHTILDSVNFEVYKNETLAVIGPNGAGKTTLFKAILGLIPYTGKVTWTKNIKIGYVPQRLYIEKELPLTTKEFFLLKENSIENAIAALKSVGLFNKTSKHHEEHFTHHIFNNRVGSLSGGELQRVLIAWALIDNPNILLFDEPTAGVDIAGEETIYTLLERLRVKKGLTILLISHELEIVYKYAMRVVCLNKERVCYGPPKQVLDKTTLDKMFGEEVHIYTHGH